LQREHSALLSKLEFICDLVHCVVSVAEERRSPLAQSLIIDKSRGDDTFVDEVQRCVEQLVLYVRALHLLSSGLQLAQSALRDGNLDPSKTASRSEFEYCERSGVAGPLAARCGGQICRPVVLGFGKVDSLFKASHSNA